MSNSILPANISIASNLKRYLYIKNKSFLNLIVKVIIRQKYNIHNYILLLKYAIVIYEGFITKVN